MKDESSYLSLTPLLSRGIDVLPVALRALAAELGSGFSTFADCGAGVGGMSVKYREILRESLPSECADAARVYCYEPLPENVAAMTQALGEDPAFVVRPVAVSDRAGEASFSVPTRLDTDWWQWSAGTTHQWSAGTSYNGFLSEPSEWHEQITVETVRLEDEAPPRFDFVKLDLQGGEHSAIIGLGEKLEMTKLLHVEHQLLAVEESIPLLRDRGFITLFDQVQLGISRTEFDSTKFAEAGIAVLSAQLTPEGDGEVAASGYLSSSPWALDDETLSLSAEAGERVRELGVSYLQTDVLAIHPSVVARVFVALGRL